MIASIVILSCVLQLTTADYSSSYSCPYSQGSSAAVSVVGNLCLDVIAKLGFKGALDLLNGVYASLEASASANILCYTEINAYVNLVVGILVKANLIALVSGSYQLVAGAVVSAAAVAALFVGVAGGVIISAGVSLLLGLSATLDLAFFVGLNALSGLCLRITGLLACISGTCLSSSG